jgi:hypothetical protein
MVGAGERIEHHDLCFGCGLANPFGLQLELEGEPGREVRGRFFVKQDHQGPDGAVHDGILAAALADAMALAVGGGRAERLELQVSARAAVGTYVEVAARSEGNGRATAEARGDGERLAAARGAFVDRAEEG